MDSSKVPPDAIKAFRLAATIVRDRADDIKTLVDPPSTQEMLQHLAASFDGMASGDADGFIEHFETLTKKRAD